MDARGHDRWRVRDMIFVSQEQLQSVRPRLQRDLRFCLAGAKMEVVEITGNRLVERWELGIDQEVVMPRIRVIGARGRNPNVGQTEMNDQVGRYCLTILHINEIDRRARRRGRRTPGLRCVLGPRWAEAAHGRDKEGKGEIAQIEQTARSCHGQILSFGYLRVHCGGFREESVRLLEVRQLRLTPSG